MPKFSYHFYNRKKIWLLCDNLLQQDNIFATNKFFYKYLKVLKKESVLKY